MGLFLLGAWFSSWYVVSIDTGHITQNPQSGPRLSSAFKIEPVLFPPSPKPKGCSIRALSQVSPAFHAFPRSKPLRFLGALQGHRPRWAVTSVPLSGPNSSGDQVLGEHTVTVGPCILFTSQSWQLDFPGVPQEHFQGVLCISSWELISGCDTPGRCQLSRIPRKTCLATGSLLTVWWKCGLWVRVCGSLLPSGSVCHIPASLPLKREGPIWQPACSPLAFAQSFVQ